MDHSVVYIILGHMSATQLASNCWIGQEQSC